MMSRVFTGVSGELMKTPLVDNLVESIRLGTAMGVCEGSLIDKFGTTCWIVENGLGNEMIV